MANAVRETKILSASDIEDTFEIPPDWSSVLGYLPDGQMERRCRLSVLDWRGFTWEFRYTDFPDLILSPDIPLRLSLPRFFERVEWQRFVQRNGLRTSDRLIIEAQEPGSGFRFRAQRFVLDQAGESDWRDLL